MAARGQAITDACPYSNWSQPEPDPSAYLKGKNNLSADYPYFELENEQHAYRHLARALLAPRIEYLPL